LQVEIVRFRTDAKSVGDVIIERAGTLGAAAVVRFRIGNNTLLSMLK